MANLNKLDYIVVSENYVNALKTQSEKAFKLALELGYQPDDKANELSNEVAKLAGIIQAIDYLDERLSWNELSRLKYERSKK